MTDEETAASVVTYWQASDHWPWECLKFAERSGLEMSYFLPAVEGALRLRDWPDRMIEVPTGLPERIFRLLRERARRECGLAAPAALPADRDETEYPNPNFKNIKGESKRAGDIRILRGGRRRDCACDCAGPGKSFRAAKTRRALVRRAARR